MRPRTIILVGALVTVFLMGVSLRPPVLLLFLENKVLDSFSRAARHRPPTGSVVVVDIDEWSLVVHGQWPWPRYRIAALLTKLASLSPASVAIDMVFPEPDRTSLLALRRQLKQDLAVDLDVDGMPPEALDNDRALESALSRGPFVLGYQFTFEAGQPNGEGCVLHPLDVAQRGGTGVGAALFEATGAICNLPEFSGAAGASGFLNAVPDVDGILRRVPMVIGYRDRVYPSLALAAFLKARAPEKVALEIGPEGTRRLRLDGRGIPLDTRGGIMVNYRGRRGVFPHISAADVLGNQVRAEQVKGKMVIVGASAAGLLEFKSTPLEPAEPGPEIHASVIDNLIAGDPLARSPWVLPLELLLVFIAGSLAVLACIRMKALWGLGMVVAGTAFFGFGSAFLFWGRQQYVSPVLPTVTLVISFGMLVSLRAWLAERQVRERTHKLALTQDAIIQSMAALAETRDQETGGHIQRTRHYVRELAMELRNHPRFREFLNEATIDLLFRLAPLHDIGKVGVRDGILLKETRLSPEEFEEMKRHTGYGSRTIRNAQQFLGEDTFLHLADEFALTHQEKWDGSGYPQGIKGEDIPIAGRLMAVADVYDALISRRGYKQALSHEEALDIMKQGRGTHFDPDVLDAFLKVNRRFREIAERFAGGGVEPEPPADR